MSRKLLVIPNNPRWRWRSHVRFRISMLYCHTNHQEETLFTSIFKMICMSLLSPRVRTYNTLHTQGVVRREF